MLVAIATQYVLDLLTENEELKKLPQAFVSEAVGWVKSWFLKPDDPKTNAKLEDPDKSIEVKKDIIQDVLAELADNAAFQQALEVRIAALAAQRARIKNVVSNTDIDVEGDIHVGDKGSSPDDTYDEKNILKDSTVKAGGNFRLGDDVIAGNGQVHIVHNHFAHPKDAATTTSPTASPKSALKARLANGKTAEVIAQLLVCTETNDKDAHNTVSLLSARLNRLKEQENRGIVGHDEAGIERNKINVALADSIDALRPA